MRVVAGLWRNRRVRSVVVAGAVVVVAFVSVVLGLVAAAGSEYELEPGPWVLVSLAAVWIPQTLLFAARAADRRNRPARSGSAR